MKAAAKPNIVIIGTGHLAWHLAVYFKSKGIHPEIVNHRDSKNLQNFKNKLKCRVYTSLAEIPRKADYYLVCVSDRSVSAVSAKLKKVPDTSLILHCSGTLPLETIRTKDMQRAVMYPLQSFTTGSHTDWAEVPLLLEAHHPLAKRKLNQLAGLFPGKKLYPDQNQRLLMHLCAVLVNNFTNLLYSEAFFLLEKSGHSSLFPCFFPLIRKAADKLKEMTPLKAQTGPAKRGDQLVLNKHRALLKQDKDLLKLYNLLSKRIQIHETNANA